METPNLDKLKKEKEKLAEITKKKYVAHTSLTAVAIIEAIKKDIKVGKRGLKKLNKKLCRQEFIKEL